MSGLLTRTVWLLAVLFAIGCATPRGPRMPPSPEIALGSCDGDMVRGLFTDAESSETRPQIRALVVRFAGTDSLAKQFGMRVGSTLIQKMTSYARQALDMEHSGLTAASLRARFIPCVISDHEHARAIGRVAGADIVMWGQTFCNWRKPGPCQFVELHLEGANRSNTIRGSPHASLVNNVGIHSAPETAAETEFATSLTVVRWVGLEADGTADEPIWGGRHLAGADLPQLTSPRAKLLIDFVLGLYAYRSGRHGLAAEFFQRSQASVAVAGVQGLPELYRMMGTSYVIAGRTQEGLQVLKKANDSCQPDQISCRALGLSSLGWAMNRLEKPREALAYFDNSLVLDRQQGNRAAEAVTLNNLGLVYQKLGDRTTALALCQSALPLARQANCRHDEATMLDSLGALHDAAGDSRKAEALYQQALIIHRQLGDLGGQAHVLHNLGSLYQHQSQDKRPQSLEFYREALRLWEQVGDTAGAARTKRGINSVSQALGLPDPRQTLRNSEGNRHRL